MAAAVASGISNAAQPAAPLNLENVNHLISKSAVAVASQLFQALLKKGVLNQTTQQFTETRFQALQSVDLTRTDKKTWMVYNLLFNAAMETICKGTVEQLMLTRPLSESMRQKVEAAKIKANLDAIQAEAVVWRDVSVKLNGVDNPVQVTPVEALRCVVPSFVIPEAIALTERLRELEPAALEHQNLWNVSEKNVKLYEAYNID